MRGPQADRRPDLGAVDDEVVVVQLGPAAQPGEVAPGVGLAEALAPDLVGAEDPLQVHLLLGRARGSDGGSHVLDAEHRDAPWCRRAVELGVARDLVLDAEAAAADLDRPRRRAPAACSELALELDQAFPLVGLAPPSRGDGGRSRRGRRAALRSASSGERTLRGSTRTEGRPRAEQVRRLPDPPDVAADGDARPAATATPTTGTGSTATRTTASSTSASAPRCTRTSGSSTAGSASCATASSTPSTRRGARRSEPTDLRIGPFEIDVLEPMRRIRVSIDDNDTGIAADLTFTARTACVEEGRQIRSHGRRLDHGRHPLRAVRAAGRARSATTGKTVPIDATRVYGTKDRCWGVRGVGIPDPGLAPTPPGSTQAFFLWAPIHWDDRCTHFGVFEDADANRWHTDGVVLPVYVVAGRHPRRRGSRHRAARRRRRTSSTTSRARGAPGTRASRWCTPTAGARTSTSSRSSASA